MAFNGSGAFVRLYNWVSDRNAAIKIRADRMDAEMDGFATGLSNCITKDGQTTVTANIPFNNKRLTGVGDATAATDALNRQTGDLRYNVGSRLRQITVYTAGATWTKQSWTKAVRVTVVGGGGSGGSPQASASNMAIAGGGGAGGQSIRFILAASLGATETVTVGAGGTGPSAPSAGVAGGSSSFGALATATGGAGGDSDLSGTTAAGQRAGGEGGIGSSGDVNIAGAPGGTGIRFNGTTGHGGVGGSGPYGGGGRGVPQGSAGVAGRGYGAGGSGGASNDSTGRLGGNGVAGIVIVEEFE